MIKAIETVYRGVKFRSKLEAQWAVYFDACGADWEYEPEGYDLGDGIWYLPDFLLRNVKGRPFNHKPGNLWIEVKGVMNEVDEKKIWKFATDGHSDKSGSEIINPILVLGKIPNVCDFEDLVNECEWISDDGIFFNYYTVDGDYWPCFPGLNQDYEFTLMEAGKAYQYRNNEDWHKTVEALYKARNYRFDHRSG